MDSMIDDNAQHEVMVINASNVVTQGWFLAYKNRVWPRMALLLAPVCIVIKYLTLITSLQFDASHIGTICLVDIAFLGSMAIELVTKSAYQSAGLPFLGNIVPSKIA